MSASVSHGLHTDRVPFCKMCAVSLRIFQCLNFFHFLFLLSSYSLALKMSFIILGTSVLGSALWSHQVAQCSGLSCYLFPFITAFALQTLLLIVYNVLLYPFYLSPLRHLPHPKQPSLRHRFLTEPGHRFLRIWINEIPNDGLIRYYGLFNSERVLVTRPSGCKEVLQLQGYNYIKFPWALEMMGQIAPLGVLVAPPEKHKVSISK